MILLERDEDVGIGCSEEAAGCVLRIHRRVRQANVVEDVVHLVWRDSRTNGLLDKIAKAGCLLDAGSGLGARGG